MSGAAITGAGGAALPATWPSRATATAPTAPRVGSCAILRPPNSDGGAGHVVGRIPHGEDDGTLELRTAELSVARGRRHATGTTSLPALVLAWSGDEPERVGEVLLVPRQERVFGRELAEGPARLALGRQRPGRSEETGPLRSRRISRRQLILCAEVGGTLHVRNVGRCPMRHEGERTEEARVRPGETLEIEGQALFLCAERPLILRALRYLDGDLPPFGGPDALGLVGESPAAWALRDRLAFVAPRPGHVLVLGRSGTGKELVARAVHERSDRGRRPLISRNAATIPESLVDAELFGNARNYPNPGMAERRGLVGDADGSTLFLDEIGELPALLQAHLLRLMDSGEYQRLGEGQVRRADLRIVGATNRGRDEMKHDFSARFRHEIAVPDLDARREDIPLLVRHLLRGAVGADPALCARFLDSSGIPRVTSSLIEAILHHPLPLQVRELDGILWQCLSDSPGDRVDATEALEEAAQRSDPGGGGAVDPASLTPEAIQACLDKYDGVQAKVWRELGLPNRYVLRRLVRKHRLRTGADEE